MKTFFFMLMVGFVSASLAKAESTTQVKWLGHAAFEIVTPKGKTLYVDPWITNPASPKGKEILAGINKADYILITHAHADHVGDAVALAKKTGAKVVANFELGNQLVRLAALPATQAGMDTLGNPGGELKLADGEISVVFTPAIHSSGMDDPNKGGDKRAMVYGGNPMGFVIRIQDGPTIYHTGDTAFFKDMEVIGETYRPDLCLINIGGHFGMEPPMAAKAASELECKVVVPHHFKTFPILTQNAQPFFELLDKRDIKHRELPVGGVLTYEGKKLK